MSGLVNGLTGPLTGSGGTPAAPSAPAGNSAAAPTPGSTPAPGAASGAPGQSGGTPATEQGLNLPPLIPGLLPGLGLDGN